MADDLPLDAIVRSIGPETSEASFGFHEAVVAHKGQIIQEVRRR